MEEIKHSDMFHQVAIDMSEMLSPSLLIRFICNYLATANTFCITQCKCVGGRRVNNVCQNVIWSAHRCQSETHHFPKFSLPQVIAALFVTSCLQSQSSKTIAAGIVASLPLSCETTQCVVFFVMWAIWEWSGGFRPIAKGHPHSALLVENGHQCNKENL